MALTPGQEKCVATLNESLVVAAGAGSGKTFTLTRRIVHALSSGYLSDIGQVLAITYTNKAAGELKSRIRGALRAEGLVDQALKVDDAWVSTIHGMCSRILRAHALEVGLDPSFRVVDEAEAQALMDLAVDEVLGQASGASVEAGAQGAGGAGTGGMARVNAQGAYGAQGAGGESIDARVASTHGVDALFSEYRARSGGGVGGTSIEDMLKRLATVAAESPLGVASCALPPKAEPGGRLVARMVQFAEDVLADAQDQKPSAKRDEFIAKTEAALEACAAFLQQGASAGAGIASVAGARGNHEEPAPFATDAAAAPDAVSAASTVPVAFAADGPQSASPVDIVSLLNTFPVPNRGFGSASYKDRALDVAAAYKECMAEARMAAAEPLLHTLAALAQRVLAAYARRKREANGLDNDDLLTLAARAMEEHPAIAADYANRFKLVMVDEFQDTNQMQVDMIRRLAGANCERLCVVGDAQQSIYRFRGADVAVYQNHLEAVRNRHVGGIIQLPDNFRSHADVLAFVDRLFERPEGFGKLFMSLAPARDEARVERPFKEGGPRIDVQLFTQPSRGVSAGRMREEQAAGIARRFDELRAAGHRAGEMVVLLGATTYAAVYAQALRDVGFACVVAKGSIFNKAPEVQLMVRLAQTVANFMDTAALFDVLSSELFALDGDDLLALSTTFDAEKGIFRRRPLDWGLAALARAESADVAGEGGSRDGADASLPDAPDISPQLACAVRVLDKARRAVGRKPVASIMMDVVVDSGWLSRLEAQGPEGQAVAGNVLKAIRMVEAIERSESLGLASAAQRFAAQVSASKEAPGALSAKGGDFVRIMTIHSSKGLEFPIVAVAELRAGKAVADKLLVERIDGIAHLSLDVDRTVADQPASSLASQGGVKCGGYHPCADFDEGQLLQAVQNPSSAASYRSALLACRTAGEAQEAVRLFYVALTRAKEALVVSLAAKRTKDYPNGKLEGVHALVQRALCGVDGEFEEGQTLFDFGGGQPARVNRIDLEPEAAEADASVVATDGVASMSAKSLSARCGVEGDAGVVEDSVLPEKGGGANGDALASADEGLGAADVSPVAAEPPFSVPVVMPEAVRADTPYKPTRKSVFSYSSLSDSEHEGSDAGGESAAREDSFDDDNDGGSEAISGSFPAQADGLNECYGWSDDDERAWEAIGMSSADADKATNLGTAFHRLAQYAVATRIAGCALERPLASRVDALCRSCSVSPVQRMRLEAAIDRWFASTLATQVAAYESVRAEVPFFIALDNEGEPIYLEGEIDLLATQGAAVADCADAGGTALIVDYKTGGHADESPDDLLEKHRLQATCYAYAVLSQGYRAVDAVFVRVEQEGGTPVRLAADGQQGEAACLDETPAPRDPQYVHYRFAAADCGALARTITAAYRKKPKGAARAG